MNIRRIKRTGVLIKMELADILLKRVKDPRVKGLVITDVVVNSDLSQAKVFFSLLDKMKVRDAVVGFKSAASFLRRELSNRLQSRGTPYLVPVYDPSFEKGLVLEKLINEVCEKGKIASSQEDSL